VLERELESNPRVLSIGLHPHIAGVPHRVYYLEKALDMLMRRSDTIFVTSGEIADWFVAADKTGLADLDAALKSRPKPS
jgi:allantoinase